MSRKENRNIIFQLKGRDQVTFQSGVSLVHFIPMVFDISWIKITRLNLWKEENHNILQFKFLNKWRWSSYCFTQFIPVVFDPPCITIIRLNATGK